LDVSGGGEDGLAVVEEEDGTLSSSFSCCS